MLAPFGVPAGTAAGATPSLHVHFAIDRHRERVALSARHAWSLRLANGLHLTLGRDADLAEHRLARFVEAYASSGTNGVPQVVDLRYPNGFALRVKGGA